jgi:glutathione peroxidase
MAGGAAAFLPTMQEIQAMKRAVCLLSFVVAGAIAMNFVARAASVEKSSTPLNQTMKTLDGEDVNLTDKYKGKVVLLVNVASKCGNTPQYKPLEGLHEKFASQGLAIVGVPCNQFGGQEPGTAAEITEFCTKNYGVKFDMLSKVDVNGGDACPLYKFLTSKESDPQFGGPITWNFEKFLFDRHGNLVMRFSPKVQPDSVEVVSAIETELAKP